MKPKAKRTIKNIITIAIILIAVAFFEWWGFWGLVIFFFTFLIYRFYSRRDLFMVFLRDVETRIFGRALDKDNWDKGEVKNTKFKFVWGKNARKKKTN